VLLGQAIFILITKSISLTLVQGLRMVNVLVDGVSELAFAWHVSLGIEAQGRFSTKAVC